MKNIALVFIAAAGAVLGIEVLTTAGWTTPPIHSTQDGYRGLSIGQLSTEKTEKLQQLANVLPDPIDKASPNGDKATKVYQNVTVLTDLSADQFNRVMLGLAAWVAPADQGCNFCHNPDNLADDSVYAKKVSRVMLQMTRHINQDWQKHVAATGVTCYTCHRGQPVPKNVWFKDPAPKMGSAATNDDLGHPNWTNGSTSLNTDPYTGYLDVKGAQIRFQPTQALPVGVGASLEDTYKTYSLMFGISKGLGVNCTFCHDSRAFYNWSESSPKRVTSWYGIALAQDLNVNFLSAIKADLPANRLGPTGDGPKVNCATCHNGANKPLLGVSLAKDWPELGGVVAKP